MKRRILVTIMCILSAAAAQSPAPPVYIFNSKDNVFLIQWTEAGGQLTGSYQHARIDRVGMPVIKSQNAAFTGTRQGTSVNLLFRTTVFGVEIGNVINASLTPSSLILNLPSPTGGFSKVAFTKGSLNDYNTAVSKLQTTVAKEQQAVLDANRKRDEAARVAAREANLVARDASIKSLQQLISTGAALRRMSGELKAPATVARISYKDALTLMRKMLSELKSTLARERDCDRAVATRNTIVERMERELLPLVRIPSDPAIRSVMASTQSITYELNTLLRDLDDIERSLFESYALDKQQIPVNLQRDIERARASANEAQSIIRDIRSDLASVLQPGDQGQAMAIIQEASMAPVAPDCK